MSTPDAKSIQFDPDIADALKPSREAIMEAENSVPGGANALKDGAAIDARRAMNSMQTVAAALSLVQDLPPEKQAQRFLEVLEQAGALSRRILLRWGVNPDDRNNRWMSNAIEKALLPHLEKIPTDDEGVDALSTALAQRSAQTPGIEAYRQERSVDIAILRGVADLMKAQAEFDFGRKGSHDQDIATLRDLVVSSALTMMEVLCPPLAPPPERATFLSIGVAQAFNQMEASWKKNAVSAARALQPLNKDQIAAWRRANPQGFSLDPVVATFRQNMARLERLTLAARKADRRR